MIKKDFWEGKRVFISGHTGFKGSWLCLWLHMLGADVTGYAQEPPTEPNMFNLCKLNNLIKSVIGDIRDKNSLEKALKEANPEIIIHMAAQTLVRESYKIPSETYSVNVMGTVNLLEGIRNSKGVKSVVNITTDKCYENKEWLWGYRENESIGGYDPYSNSKACSELITASYRNSFFNSAHYNIHGVALASARAGNVIGGGDWAADRLIPDCIKAILKGEEIAVRNPNAIRPWQHVIEPVSGYLTLAQKLYESGPDFAEAWNFGPSDDNTKPVEWVVKKICETWGKDASYCIIQEENQPHEATYLRLDCSKAKFKLSWTPKWSLEQAIIKTVEWVQAYKSEKDLKQVCYEQIESYCKACRSEV